VHAKQIRAVLAKYDAIIKKAAEEDGEGVCAGCIFWRCR
jgi:hypothetical protein